MKTNKQNPLESKYLEGETSLSEEEQFFSNQVKEGRFKPWAQYKQENQVTKPNDLVKAIAAKIDSKEPINRNLLITITSVAATIALIIVFFFKGTTNNAMSYEEKSARLNEILNILPEQQANDEYVIYEDEIIVIYLETK